MNAIEKLLPQLKTLRLSGILDTVEVRNQQAIEQKLSHLDFLALVLNDEFERRENKKLHHRLRKANFQNDRTLENFRFDQPGLTVNKEQSSTLRYRHLLVHRGAGQRGDSGTDRGGQVSPGSGHRPPSLPEGLRRSVLLLPQDDGATQGRKRRRNTRAAFANPDARRLSHPRRLRSEAAGLTGR